MLDILITADNLTFADDLRTALAAVWPDARYHLDPQQSHDVVLHIGEQPFETTRPVLRLKRTNVSTTDAEYVQAPVKLLALAHRLKDLAARPVHYEWQGYRLDTASRLWQAPDQPAISLTEKEVALLVYLGTQYPTSVSRDDLLRDVWNYASGSDTHTVETHLYRLRQKIEVNPDQPAIVVNNGEGYILGILA